MGCCRDIGTCLLLIINIFIYLGGLALILVGIIYEVGFTTLTDKLDEVFPALRLVPILVIVAGCTAVLISFFGWSQNSFVLLRYAAVLFTTLLLKIALASYAFIKVYNSDDWRAELAQALGRLFNAGGQPVDFVHQTLECCGFNTTPVINIPSSCCSPQVNPCVSPFQQVCEFAFYHYINHSLDIIGIIAVSLAAIEFLGVIIAICVARKR